MCVFFVPSGITSSRLDEYPVIYKVMFEDLVFLAATWANLLLWRGAWDLCVEYVIPDPMVGGWICHWIGTVSLILFQVREKHQTELTHPASLDFYSALSAMKRQTLRRLILAFSNFIFLNHLWEEAGNAWRKPMLKSW